MEKYFNVKLEFDKEKVDNIIEETISRGGKGYVCSVEGNVLATANKNPEYLEIINDSLVNICDGSSIAMLASHIHGKKFKTYVGADLFIDYIKKRQYKSFFLGNTTVVLNGLKDNLSQIDSSIKTMKFVALPFKNVNDFNYQEIAKVINENKPDIIWVSLGAPKQEVFMSKLLPLINKGVMFGFGAIFNFYSLTSGEKRAHSILLKMKLEWLYRIIMQPQKQLPKAISFLKIFPKLYFNEKTISKIQNKTT